MEPRIIKKGIMENAVKNGWNVMKIGENVIILTKKEDRIDINKTSYELLDDILNIEKFN